MTITITKADALRALEEAVAERGEDYVYESPKGEECFYQVSGAPSCGVGLALTKLGVTIDDLVALDTGSSNGKPVSASPKGQNGDDLGHVLFDRGIVVDVEAQEVFAAFQYSQDSFDSWGDALNDARKEAA